MNIEDCFKNNLTDPERRKIVMNELVKNEDHAIEVLIECLKLPQKNIFNLAFSILSDLESPILIKKLIDELKTKDSSMRSIIYELLLNTGRNNVEYLTKQLRDDDSHIRKLIIDVFTNLKLYLDLKYIKQLLNDKNINVKYAICEYIIKNNIKDVVPLLKEKLKMETDEWFLYIILEAIGKLGEYRDIKEIINYSTNNMVILKNILKIISKLGTKEQLAILLPLLTINNNNNLRKYVVKSLYELITYNNITKDEILESTPNINYIIKEARKMVLEIDDTDFLLQLIAFLSEILNDNDSDCLIKFFTDDKNSDFIFAILNISLKFNNKKFVKIYEKYVNSDDYLISNMARKGLKKYK